MDKCEFIVAWVGKCGNPTPCEEHQDLKCSSCGEPATHECPETSQMVCGAPLCDKCEHLVVDGVNGDKIGSFYDHVKKRPADDNFKMYVGEEVVVGGVSGVVVAQRFDKSIWDYMIEVKITHVPDTCVGKDVWKVGEIHWFSRCIVGRAKS